MRLVVGLIILAITVIAATVSLLAKPAFAATLKDDAAQYSTAVPPIRFQYDAGAVVQFKNEPSDLCGLAEDPLYIFVGCQANDFIVLPNPCAYTAEFYARIACHELGHLNGWSADHGDQ